MRSGPPARAVTWRYTGIGATWIAEAIFLPWPDGLGTFAVGGCAPEGRWAEVQPALLALAGSVVPTLAHDPEHVIERAAALSTATLAWREILPPAEVLARVVPARTAALATLRALPGAPEDPKILLALGDVEALDDHGRRLGRGYAAADMARDLGRAVGADPRPPRWAQHDLGRALLDLGEPARALPLLEAAVAPIGGRPAESAQNLFDLGEAYRALGHGPDAAALYARARARLAEERRLHSLGRQRDAEMRANLDALERALDDRGAAPLPASGVAPGKLPRP
jgi:tetratricopeptide (TPR) repeat protein